MILSALVQSFKILPPGIPLSAIQISKGCWYVVSLGSYIFYLGVQLASPVLLIVFLVDFGFGLLNKVAEQVNVFQIGFQIKPTNWDCSISAFNDTFSKFKKSEFFSKGTL